MTGVSPLDVLLSVMRERWKADDKEGAVALARLAAPYMHGRAAVARPAGELSEVPDDELDGWSSDGGAAAAGEGAG